MLFAYLLIFLIWGNTSQIRPKLMGRASGKDARCGSWSSAWQPLESKIAQSYHWLELELARLRQRRKVLGRFGLR